MRHTLLASPSALAAALLLGAPAAEAQQFVGSVLQPDGRTPAAGVIVVARDSAGREVAQAVSGAEGRFVLFVDSARTVSLRLHRTGFAPTDGPTRKLATDEVADVAVTLGAAPIRIPALKRGASSCGRASPEDRAAVSTVLEEARKAFVAAQAVIGRNDLRARYATFEHRVAKTGEDTLRSLLRRSTGALPSLFRATTPEELEEGGFFALVSSERVFRAPEPGLLASAWFTNTHCFSLLPQGDTALRVAFRPSRERKGLVDLEGAYVLDPRTLALRRVEFTFQGLRDEERHANAGGVLEFVQLSDGDWLTSRWYQRFPLLGYRTSDGATTLVRTSMTLIDIIGHRVIGGRVLAVLHDDTALMRSDAVDAATARTEFGRACPERLARQSTGVARGRLAPIDSESVAAVLVRVTWDEPVVVDRTTLTKREHIREAYTDDQGAWVLCDIPVRREITLRWDARGKERTIAFTVPSAGAVITVSGPPTP